MAQAKILRWTASRKASLLTLIERRELTVPDACERFNITLEELESWMAAKVRGGSKALKSSAMLEARRGTP